MEKQYEKKITWTIKNFSSLQSEKLYSLPFVVGGSKWRFLVYPKGKGVIVDDYLSLYLDVPDSDSLPNGWKRHTKFRLTVVNQIWERISQHKEGEYWFDQKMPTSGFSAMLPLNKLIDINDGFLVNGEVKVVAEVGVLEVIGGSDVLEETLLVHESVDVNGFQVLPSQVESVNNLFNWYPDIASKFCLENPHLRTTYLNSLLSLTEIMCKSPKKLSNNDLVNAYSTLSYVAKAGFKLDWLEKELKEVGQTRARDIEEELKDMKQKCADMEALLEFLR
ncbi:PREDICTED: MATH domain and coiled-coil domain-containing protein At1g31390-like [Camelina sativa]|uniref:MATH domain and coiled-coil domain-containing protein At1g31390-like n=1 Tax=Camelina sativa TaxID=90675 RepID=A0ABM1R5F0_CAMSA|nr:PREDICTED: MATH domain and coiled-coil domain-containing protein At1g31390-like [Camelina sativa]